MTRQFVPAALAMLLCLAVSLAHGEQRGKQEEKSGRGGKSPGGNQAERKSEGQHGQGSRGAKPGGNKKSPGGEWSERTHGGKQSNGQPGNHHAKSGASGAAAGHAAATNKAPQASGGHAPAAG